MEEVEFLEADGAERFTRLVQRLLAPRENKATQRHLIFRTKWTIQKVCEVIIDNNSFDNVVSKTLVKAMELLIAKH